MVKTAFKQYSDQFVGGNCVFSDLSIWERIYLLFMGHLPPRREGRLAYYKSLFSHGLSEMELENFKAEERYTRVENELLETKEELKELRARLQEVLGGYAHIADVHFRLLKHLKDFEVRYVDYMGNM